MPQPMVVRHLLPALVAVIALALPATASPLAPVVLLASADGGHVDLTWTAPAVGTAKGYLLTRTVDGVADPPVAVDGQSYQDTPPQGALVVTYIVQWVDDTGSSSLPSNPIVASSYPPCPWIGLELNVPPDHIPPISYFDPECLVPA